MYRGVIFLDRGFDQGRENLKRIALLTMTVDHIGKVLFPSSIFMRIIGRISFPLYSYLLVLGMESTRNVENYFSRLIVFAIISQAPFSLTFGYSPLEKLNIFFTLSLGILTLWKPILVLPSFLIAELLNFDYGAYGIVTIWGMKILKNSDITGIITLIFLNAVYIVLSQIQAFSLLALPLIILYNKGFFGGVKEIKDEQFYQPFRRYFFYIYYPLHLLFLYIAKSFV